MDLRKLFDIGTTACAVAIALALLVGAQPTATVRLPATEARTVASRPFYPLGWFDRVDAPGNLVSMRSEGMNAVVPYNELGGATLRSYLDQAQSHGLKVFVEIDRVAVGTATAALVQTFVMMYRAHPAVAGWLLADEPTIDPAFRSLTPAKAAALYRTIKGVDHKPVAIVFGVHENPRPWLGAMDVLMYDDYVTDQGQKEFYNLKGWLQRLQDRGRMAAKLDGYMPLIQSYGPDAAGRPQETKRLPTRRELRYLTFTAMQYRATGIWFWARYRSRPAWIQKTLTPLSREISPAIGALRARPVSGASGSGTTKTALFRDPRSGARYLVVVNHSPRSMRATINVARSLGMRKATSKTGGSYDISDGSFVRTFSQYEAQMYRLTR